MGKTIRTWWNGIGEALKARFFMRRQQTVNLILSLLYGTNMQVVPQGYVGLAGAVVMWFIENGQRYFVMVRQEPSLRGGDGKARFISCLGLHGSNDVGANLKAVARLQLGDIFVKTAFGRGALGADRVAAAPLFNHTDDTVGVPVPVQGLVWVVQVNPHALDIIASPEGIQALRVPENVMTSDKVSPTHKALYQAVQRHLPKLKPMPATRTERVEESVREIAGGVRIVH